MSTLTPPDTDQPVHGLYFGRVLDVTDPDRRGRVRVQVPGLTERSGWASPVGNPGAGSPGRGLFFVPEVGATVLVGFIAGDIDVPIFWPGPWSAAGAPATARGESAVGAPSVHELETETFLITIREIAGGRYLRLANKRDGAFIEINDAEDSITLDAQFITIRGQTAVAVEGMNVAAAGRRILSYGDRG